MAQLPDYYLPPQLPPVPPYVPPTSTLSRPAATTINAVSPTLTQLTANETASGRAAPILYGEDRIAGRWLTAPVVDSGELVFAIMWCMGEIEGVQAVYINGEAVPGGVTMTHYTGTDSQGIDPTLDAVLAGFADTYKGVAYTVFSVPPGTITGFPQQRQIEAVIHGRKVFDPRTSTTAWTRNPALCMADLAALMGKTAYGVEECADHCDELVGGTSIRCSIGLSLLNPASEEANLDLMAAYAEVLWSYHEDGILMVPDAKVDGPVAILTTDDIIEGTFRIMGNDALRTPTSVTVTHRAISGTAAAWGEQSVTQVLAGVDEGEIARIQSDLSMPGIQRAAEANRKALMRLRRLNYPTTYAWQAFDDGVKFQRGDVVQLPNTRGLVDRLVRILSIDQVAAGQHQMTAEVYNADMYAFDGVPGTTSVIPQYGIVPFDGESIPAGWAAFATADGYFIKGIDSGESEGEITGSNSFTVSGTTSLAGGHTGSADEPGLPGWIANKTGSGGSQVSQLTEEPDHAHGYASGPVSHQPNYVQRPLIQKTGSAGDLPKNAWLLADGQLISPTLAEVTAYLGRMLKAGSAATGGNASPRSVSVSYDSVGNHDHTSPASNFITSGTLTFYPAFNKVAAGAHSHTGSVTVTANPKRARLAAYMATADTEVTPGGIILFPESETLPAGWYDCDGNNGTINMQGARIQLVSASDAGSVVGDDTVTWTGTTSTNPGHSHKGSFVGNIEARRGYHPDAAGAHNHTSNGSAPYAPLSMSLRFIQYTGVI